MKNERDKSLDSKLYFDKKTNPININSFNSIVLLNETIDDKSEIGTMKDSYTIDLFFIKSTIQSLVDENFTDLAFILPFNLILTALASHKLTIQTRIKFLSKAFESFADYYKNFPDTKKGSFL